MLVIQHQPHGPLAHFRGELVRRFAHDGSTFVRLRGVPPCEHRRQE